MGEDSEDDQCAPTGMPVLGRRMSRTSGSKSRKMIPSNLNTWTNETIAACYWTSSVTAAYARRAAVAGSAPDAK